MRCMTRSIIRLGLIGGLALGGAALLWPGHVSHGLSAIKGKAQQIVDQNSDSPEAIRRELARLADEYPDRIAEVRGELAEVEHQLNELNREAEIAERVVALTTDDLDDLKTLVARAEAEQEAKARTVAIRFDGVRFDLDEAREEGRRINNVRASYKDRLEHASFQVGLLTEQKGRLTDILEELEGEFTTYQAQLWQLDREIDAIERNDRLIALIEQQQATLDSYERFGKMENIGQVQSKLAELRTKQQAQLEFLEKQGQRSNYEEQARYELDRDAAGIERDPFEEMIEIELDDIEDEVEVSKDDLALRLPTIIE